MMLSKNFSLHEFACNDEYNTPVPSELIPNIKLLAENLQVLRDHLGEPIHINSGYRTIAYNKIVGGKPASKHLLAKASDLVTKTKTPKQLAAIIEKLIKEGRMKAGGVGIYPSFVHYDVRGRNVRW